MNTPSDWHVNRHLEVVKELLRLDGARAPRLKTVLACLQKDLSLPMASALLAWIAERTPPHAAYAEFVTTLPDKFKPAARAAFAGAQWKRRSLCVLAQTRRPTGAPQGVH